MKVKFYQTGSGRSPIEAFLKKCSKQVQSDFLDAVVWLSSGQTLSMPQSRNLSSISAGLHELRLKDRAGQYRFFYLIKKGDAIWMVHAFKKKTQELPKKEIDLVLRRLREV